MMIVLYSLDMVSAPRCAPDSPRKTRTKVGVGVAWPSRDEVYAMYVGVYKCHFPGHEGTKHTREAQNHVKYLQKTEQSTF